MSGSLIGKNDEWVLIELSLTHGTKEQFWNTSLSVQKLVATAGTNNTANVCVAPHSALSAASGVGFMLSNSGDSPYPYAFESAPISRMGSEDLSNWWADPANSNLTLNVFAKLES
jgi:hypothetical protein